jgi:hypothetical protein
VKTRISQRKLAQELPTALTHAPRSLMPMRERTTASRTAARRSEGGTMSRHEEIFDACVRAMAKSDKAVERGDFAATIDWMATALEGYVRLAKDTRCIPEDYRPRIRRLPLYVRDRTPPESS